MFGGVAGLFQFVTSVVPLLAINTAKVSAPESAGSTSDMDHWASAMVQEIVCNLQFFPDLWYKAQKASSLLPTKSLN